MANQLFADFVFTDAGVAVVGATIELFDRNTTTPVRASTTTDANGYWAISHATEGRFDVRITYNSSVRWHKYDTSTQIESIEVAVLRLRNPADTFDYDIVAGAITADRQLNLPVITGTDTISVLGLAQDYSSRRGWAKTADIPSASTITPLGTGNYSHITGTTTITAIGTLQAGAILILEFDGALTLTHNATSLILQGGTNLTTAVGDIVAFISEGSGNWRELWRRLTASSGGSTELMAIVDPQFNVSSAGTTTVDGPGDTYAEPAGQTRMTMTATRTRQVRAYGSGHVSAGTGTFQLFNFTDSASLGTNTTTATGETAQVPNSQSVASTNDGDAITLRVKNSGAGNSTSIDDGGMFEGEQDMATTVTSTGNKAAWDMATHAGWIGTYKFSFVRALTTTTCTMQLAVKPHPKVSPTGTTTYYNIGASMTESSLGSVVDRSPTVKLYPDGANWLWLRVTALSGNFGYAVGAQIKADNV